MADLGNTVLPQDTIESNSPNMRFAAAFLDYAEHKRAVPGEVMMDRRTGETVYKRFDDGKRLYFAQENIHQNNYVTQIKTFLAENKKTYIRPRPAICAVCDDTYYMSVNMDLVDFRFNDDEKNKSLLGGGKLLNPYAREYSIIQEQNGLFVQLTGRPRDRATISLLAAVYDKYYKNYVGTDAAKLKKKALYDQPYYLDSNAVVNYTLRYYRSTGEVFAEQTSDAYVRFNEVSFVPFVKSTIYSRTEVAYTRLIINSISAPKLAEGKALLKESTEGVMFEAFLDNADISVITCNVGCFMTPTDPYFTLPPEENTVPIFLMALDEFENELDKIGNISTATGVMFSVLEPDDTQWSDVNLWGEILADVYGFNDSEKTGASTNLDELEKNFGGIEYHNGGFTIDSADVTDYLIETIADKVVWETKW